MDRKLNAETSGRRSAINLGEEGVPPPCSSSMASQMFSQCERNTAAEFELVATLPH